jgi:phosphoglycolate phosphatase-like HAD superfamily hydrolase
MALDALGSSPDQAFFIGDSHDDIEAGRRAGVTTVAVTWGPFSPEKQTATSVTAPNSRHRAIGSVG